MDDMGITGAAWTDRGLPWPGSPVHVRDPSKLRSRARVSNIEKDRHLAVPATFQIYCLFPDRRPPKFL